MRPGAFSTAATCRPYSLLFPPSRSANLGFLDSAVRHQYQLPDGQPLVLDANRLPGLPFTGPLPSKANRIRKSIGAIKPILAVLVGDVVPVDRHVELLPSGRFASVFLD